MARWTAKDPDAVQDYLYTIPLDQGDSVASATFAKLSGDVTVDNDPAGERTGADVTAWLSGGTEGETNVFRIAWITTAGRESEEIITLAIISNESNQPLALTGYAKPAVAHFIARYPDFADVERTTIQYWLTDAERHVDTSWLEGDYAAGLMAIAAHHLSVAGEGVAAEATSDLPAGITAMRIGTLGLNFDTGLTRAKAEGALSSTRYGADYLRLLKRNRAGPRVSSPGVVPYDGLRYPTGSF